MDKKKKANHRVLSRRLAYERRIEGISISWRHEIDGSGLFKETPDIQMV